MSFDEHWRTAEISPELVPEVARFLTRANCLAGINFLIYEIHGPHPHESIASQTASRIKTGPRRDIQPDAGRLLRVAWQTELAASLGSAVGDSALQRISSFTLPVNAYYSLFNALRALALIRGTPADTHAAIQRLFATDLASRLPLPWGATLVGNHKDVSTCVLTPPFIEPYVVPLLERSHEPRAYLWATLRMVRKWKTEIAREDWLADRNNRKQDGSRYERLPHGQKQIIATTVRPTSLLDFVYELRRKMSYETADEYGTDVTNRDVDRFYTGMETLLDTGLLTVETTIAKLAGLPELERHADAWQRSTSKLGDWPRHRLARRLEAVRATVR